MSWITLLVSDIKQWSPSSFLHPLSDLSWEPDEAGFPGCMLQQHWVISFLELTMLCNYILLCAIVCLMSTSSRGLQSPLEQKLCVHFLTIQLLVQEFGTQRALSKYSECSWERAWTIWRMGGRDLGGREVGVKFGVVWDKLSTNHIICVDTFVVVVVAICFKINLDQDCPPR